VTDDPYLNPQGRKHAHVGDIEAVVRQTWRAWWVLLGLAAIAMLVGR